MNDLKVPWWEKQTCILCDWWWIIFPSIFGLIAVAIFILSPQISEKWAMDYLQENGVPTTYLDEIDFYPKNLQQAKNISEWYFDEQALKTEREEIYNGLQVYKRNLDEYSSKIQRQIEEDVTQDSGEAFATLAQEVESQKQAEIASIRQKYSDIILCIGFTNLPVAGTITSIRNLGSGKDACTGMPMDNVDNLLELFSLGVSFADDLKDLGKIIDLLDVVKDIEHLDDLHDYEKILEAAKAVGEGKDLERLFEVSESFANLNKIDIGDLNDYQKISETVQDLKSAGKWDDILSFAKDYADSDTRAVIKTLDIVGSGGDIRNLEKLADVLEDSSKYADLAGTARKTVLLHDAEYLDDMLDLHKSAEQAQEIGTFGRILKLSGAADDLDEVIRKFEKMEGFKETLQASSAVDFIKASAKFHPGARSAGWKIWAYENIPDLKSYKVPKAVADYFWEDDYVFIYTEENNSLWDIVDNSQTDDETLKKQMQDRLSVYKNGLNDGHKVIVVFSVAPPEDVRILLEEVGVEIYPSYPLSADN